MRPHSWSLGASAGFALIHVAGLLFGEPIVPGADGYAWLALTGYLLVAGRGLPWRVRLLLLVAPCALAAPALGDLVSTWSWFTEGPEHTGGSEPTGGLQFLSPEEYEARPVPYLAGRRSEFAALLAGYAGLVVAALLVVPARPPNRRRSVLAGVVVVLVGGYTAWQLPERPAESWLHTGDAAYLPSIMLTVTVLAGAVITVLRGGAGLLGAGLLLLAFAEATAAWYPFADPFWLGAHVLDSAFGVAARFVGVALALVGAMSAAERRRAWLRQRA